VSENQAKAAAGSMEDIYDEAVHWHINTGGETIHAKRIPGRWRTIKWLTGSVWLILFLGPYLRWNGHQAVLFDIPHRQFHLFDITILPQDFWMLSLVLLFFAILLAVVTALAGRVWCGFFCFQTVWTDWFTWIEERLEGPPQKRRKLDKAPMDLHKFRVKFVKHLVWVLIGALTGISFAAWFTDSWQLWPDLFTGKAGTVAYVLVGMFTAGTYTLAGWLREQACFWLCPYARIQGVMVDATTVLPTYDFKRGEPRGRRKKGDAADKYGDCVDCKQCVAVCPTGVDIRDGQQEGCITCALCIDACDAVMDKIKRPRGLIRYASLEEIEGKPVDPLWRRPRVWVYSAILLLAVSGIGYGLSTLGNIAVRVLHERQPLFVRLSDGSIQNRYTLKILNKLPEKLPVTLSVSGPKGIRLVGADGPVVAHPSTVTPKVVYVRVPLANLKAESMPIEFHVSATGPGGKRLENSRESVFIGPRH